MLEGELDEAVYGVARRANSDWSGSGPMAAGVTYAHEAIRAQRRVGACFTLGWRSPPYRSANAAARRGATTAAIPARAGPWATPTREPAFPCSTTGKTLVLVV